MSFFRDARDYQICFLTLFLGLGIGTRDWTLKPSVIVVAIVTCILVQFVVGHWSLVISHWLSGNHQMPTLEIQNSEFNSQQPIANSQPLTANSQQPLINIRSPLITALGLSLLLRVDDFHIMALAACLAITSKFVFRVQGKHFFNPANFGIVSVLALTDSAWVSPGQWGENAWFGLIFAGAGGIVLKKVGRWDTSLVFLGVYGGLEIIRNLLLGWTWDVVFHRLMSGSLLLFALFMVTDPRSIPNARSTRLIWAGTIGLLTFVLRNQFFLSTSMFWVLFALSPLTVLCDRWQPAQPFSWWQQPTNPVQEESNSEANASGVGILPVQ